MVLAATGHLDYSGKTPDVSYLVTSYYRYLEYVDIVFIFLEEYGASCESCLYMYFKIWISDLFENSKFEMHC